MSQVVMYLAPSQRETLGGKNSSAFISAQKQDAKTLVPKLSAYVPNYGLKATSSHKFYILQVNSY